MLAPRLRRIPLQHRKAFATPATCGSGIVDRVRGGGRGAMKGTLSRHGGWRGGNGRPAPGGDLLAGPAVSRAFARRRPCGRVREGATGRTWGGIGERRPQDPERRGGAEAGRPWYARDYGVSLDEAIRRLKMQDDRLPSDLWSASSRRARATSSPGSGSATNPTTASPSRRPGTRKP
jgi:hypothetical protein